MNFSRILLAAALTALACPALAKQPAAPQPAAHVETRPRPDIVLGKADAPVTVIEYASTTCPHCAHFHEDVFPQIKSKYIDTGVVRLIFREYPTGPAEFSYVGSVLARCAGERKGVDGYFAVLHGLFANQHPADEAQSWIFGKDPKAALLRIVAPVGMTGADFDACLKRQDLVDLINANVKEGTQAYGISGTPTFVVNGSKVELKVWSDLETAIEAARAARP